MAQKEMNFVNYSKYGKKLNAMSIDELLAERKKIRERIAEIDHIIYELCDHSDGKALAEERYRLNIYQNTLNEILDGKKKKEREKALKNCKRGGCSIEKALEGYDSVLDKPWRHRSVYVQKL